MIIITGSIVSKPDSLDEFLKLAQEHVDRSRSEPGCISHNVYVSGENPRRIFFFEEWADEAAVKAHFAVPASRDFVRQARALAEEMPPIAMYEASAFSL
jgi:quinol monooxygenase YgiN